MFLNLSVLQVSKFDLSSIVEAPPEAGGAWGGMTVMFNWAQLFDRTICGDKWLNLSAFVGDESEQGRSGCCNAGSYMSNPHNDPFVVTDGGGSCSKCPNNGLVTLQNNSDLACPTIQEMVFMWFRNPTRATAKYGPIENWNVSSVTDMTDLFRSATTFNSDLSKWQTSRVTSFQSMFRGASSFNAGQ